MQFELSEEQAMLSTMVRDLLAVRCTPDHVRAAIVADGEVAGLARSLDEVGLPLITVPEEAGGLGLGVVEACLALQALGYAGAPGPWVERLLLPEELALSGEALSGEALSGEALSGEALSGEAVCLRQAVGSAALLLGLAQRMLDLAVEHTKVREQFGRPIGSFQAVAHHLADARLGIEFAVPLLHRAAWLLDHEADAGGGVNPVAVAAWSAKHHANDAALLSARKALQTHGAMGYAHEHDLQLFMKQVWLLAPKHGDSAACRRKIAAALAL